VKSPRPKWGGGYLYVRAGALGWIPRGALTSPASGVLSGLLNGHHWGGLVYTFDSQLAHLLSRFLRGRDKPER
jgi:hypothetical protein